MEVPILAAGVSWPPARAAPGAVPTLLVAAVGCFFGQVLAGASERNPGQSRGALIGMSREVSVCHGRCENRGRLAASR